MKKAVELLLPAIEAEKTSAGTATKAGKVVFATVKGDVHDIGKNIVSIVLTCNNYEVIDLGVMTPAETILKTVREEKPDILCLSGLITPSLEEMIHVADEMQKAGMCVPIMIGGATTSKLHTALKIAPRYDYPVIHVADASQNPIIAAKLLNPETHNKYVKEMNEEYERLRMAQTKVVESKPILTPEEARTYRLKTSYTTQTPQQSGVHRIDIPIAKLFPYINWIYFFTAWRLDGRYASLSRIHDSDDCRAVWLNEYPEAERAKAREAIKLYDDAQRMLNRLTTWNEEKTTCCEAVYGFFPAVSRGDDICVGNETIPMLRQQTVNHNGNCLSLADYVAPESEKRKDYVGAFAVTVGKQAEGLRRLYMTVNDDYSLMLIQTLSDRLVEAASEYLHEKVRKELWGYAPDEKLSVEELHKAHYRGIRPAVGYPSLPDQGLMFTIDNLLKLNKIRVSLTENGALFPASSIAGFYFAHPESTYFMIGRISEEQLQDYAARRGKSATSTEKFLAKNLK
jgi:5-methyltetrahydrofolate--homocysteine methyltransferase